MIKANEYALSKQNIRKGRKIKKKRKERLKIKTK